MSAAILVAYASKAGSTRDVADSVGAVLHARGVAVEVRPAESVASLEGFDGVVLGGALYAGRLHRDARRFLTRHRARLAGMPVAVFAMGPRTMEPSAVAESRKQLDRALAHTPEVEPIEVTIFGGVVDPATLHFPFNRMPASDARDWDAIEAWSRRVADLIGTRRPPPAVQTAR
jgi:menaquinone-dependent protoporphyrinogen oxidase